jgi:hypothetical protein
MSIIPGAVHIRLRAEADDQPKGLSVWRMTRNLSSIFWVA